MAKMFNRARMTVTSTGTGALSLGVAVAGYQTFSSAGAQNNDVVSYAVEDGLKWEIGTGTYNSVAGTLSRTVTQSFDGTTYGTSAISVTTSAQVFISPLAADLQYGTSAGNLVQLDGSARLPAVDGSLVTALNASNISSGTLGVARGGTGLTSLPSGYIPYGNGTGAFSNSSNLVFDGSSLIVGLGAANRSLQIRPSAGYSGYIQFTEDAVNDRWSIGCEAGNSAFIWKTGSAFTGSEKMRIDASGNLLLGTTSALDKLYVYNGNLRLSDGYAINFGTTGTTFILGDSTNNVFRMYTSNTERMRISSAGYVGIGTSSVGTILNIKDNSSAGIQIKTADTNFSCFNIGVNTTAGYSIINSTQSGTGTTLPIAFFVGGSESMRLDANGFLGLKQSSPSYRLDMLGGGGSNTLRVVSTVGGIGGAHINAPGNTEATFTGGAAYNSYSGWYRFNPASTSASGIVFANGTTSFWGNTGLTANTVFQGTQLMLLDANGNLGLGVTPKSWGSTYTAFEAGNLMLSSNDPTLVGNAYHNGTNWLYSTTNYATRYESNLSNGAIHAWFRAASGTANATVTWLESMRIDASGNVGIGTTSPAYKLDVSSNSIVGRFNGSSTCFVDLAVGGTTNGRFGTNGFATNDFFCGTTGATPLVFVTNNTERARIDTSGRLLVGTTSTDVSVITTGGGCLVASSGYIQGARTNGSIFYANRIGSDGTIFEIYRDGVGKALINLSGTTASFAAASDKRLKENISNLPSQLDAIMAMRPVEFDWKDGSGHQIGFIAQEFEQIYPDCVNEGEDGMKQISYWNKNEARLVKAIQELAAKVQALEAKVA